LWVSNTSLCSGLPLVRLSCSTSVNNIRTIRNNLRSHESHQNEGIGKLTSTYAYESPRNRSEALDWIKKCYYFCSGTKEYVLWWQIVRQAVFTSSWFSAMIEQGQSAEEHHYHMSDYKIKHSAWETWTPGIPISIEYLTFWFKGLFQPFSPQSLSLHARMTWSSTQGWCCGFQVLVLIFVENEDRMISMPDICDKEMAVNKR